MQGEYTCYHLLRSGKVCGRTCWRPEGCYEHWKARKRYPCKACGVPTSAKPGLCRDHSGSYYAVQYVKRLREEAKGSKSNLSLTL
jgi:hypothetical protein